MTTTVAVGSQAWKELLGDFRSEAGAEIRLFDENGTLSAKHLKLVGTMAEYEVPPHRIIEQLLACKRPVHHECGIAQHGNSH